MYPLLKTGWLFKGMQALLIPDTVLILFCGLGSDRLCRIRYADIRQVRAKTAFPVVAMLAGAFFILLALLLTGWNAVATGVVAGAVGMCITILCLIRGKTVIEIFSDDVAVRIDTLWLSSGKRARFLEALVEGMRLNQDVPPLRNGVPMTEGDRRMTAKRAVSEK